MKNVTVTLDEDTAARARVQAAERKMSLSRYISEAAATYAFERRDVSLHRPRGRPKRAAMHA